MYYLYKNKRLETVKEGIVCNSLETVRKLSLLEREKRVVISGQAQWELSLVSLTGQRLQPMHKLGNYKVALVAVRVEDWKKTQP